jgi:hypothetical protein
MHGALQKSQQKFDPHEINDDSDPTTNAVLGFAELPRVVSNRDFKNPRASLGGEGRNEPVLFPVQT